jgi:tight adherence protein B
MNVSAALLSATLISFGIVVVVLAFGQRSRERTHALAELLDLPYGERDVPVESVTEHQVPGLQGAAEFAERGVRRFDRDGALSAALVTARIPLATGEYIVLAAAAAVIAAGLLGVVTSSWLLGLSGAVGVTYAASVAPRVVASRRRRSIEAELPDALSTLAASLEGGHSFLRSIQMLAEETEGPLAEEFGLVVRETSLNAPLIDSLERMSGRLRIKDLDWVVQAIRIQQTTGGKLSDVLHTLAEFMRGREELRREVKVLTAEGRMSAMVLGGMPPFLFITFRSINPSYMDGLMHGGGLIALFAAALSTVVGITMILRMVKIEI